MGDREKHSFSKKHIMLKDIPITWIRKFLTAQRLYDINDRGYAGYEDFMTMADRLIEYGKLEGKAADDVIEFYQSYGSASKAGPRSEMVAATSITQQMFALWKGRENPAVIEIWQDNYSRMFKVFDLNSSGFITFDEYLVFWRVYGLDLRFARMQFDYMDTDGDGKISEEEFVGAAIEYICNTDLDTPNRFYGPLLNY